MPPKEKLPDKYLTPKALLYTCLHGKGDKMKKCNELAKAIITHHYSLGVNLRKDFFSKEMNSEEGMHSPLSLAVNNNNPELVKLLLRYGADPNQTVGKDRTTPLHIAVLKKNVPIVKELLRYGANPEEKTAAGSTPTYLAQSQNHPEITALLAQPGWKKRLEENNARIEEFEEKQKNTIEREKELEKLLKEDAERAQKSREMESQLPKGAGDALRKQQEEAARRQDASEAGPAETQARKGAKEARTEEVRKRNAKAMAGSDSESEDSLNFSDDEMGNEPGSSPSPQEGRSSKKDRRHR